MSINVNLLNLFDILVKVIMQRTSKTVKMIVGLLIGHYTLNMYNSSLAEDAICRLCKEERLSMTQRIAA